MTGPNDETGPANHPLITGLDFTRKIFNTGEKPVQTTQQSLTPAENMVMGHQEGVSQESVGREAHETMKGNHIKAPSFPLQIRTSGQTIPPITIRQGSCISETVCQSSESNPLDRSENKVKPTKNERLSTHPSPLTKTIRNLTTSTVSGKDDASNIAKVAVKRPRESLASKSGPASELLVVPHGFTIDYGTSFSWLNQPRNDPEAPSSLPKRYKGSDVPTGNILQPQNKEKPTTDSEAKEIEGPTPHLNGVDKSKADSLAVNPKINQEIGAPRLEGITLADQARGLLRIKCSRNDQDGDHGTSVRCNSHQLSQTATASVLPKPDNRHSPYNPNSPKWPRTHHIELRDNQSAAMTKKVSEIDGNFNEKGAKHNSSTASLITTHQHVTGKDPSNIDFIPNRTAKLKERSSPASKQVGSTMQKSDNSPMQVSDPFMKSKPISTTTMNFSEREVPKSVPVPSPLIGQEPSNHKALRPELIETAQVTKPASKRTKSMKTMKQRDSAVARKINDTLTRFERILSPSFEHKQSSGAVSVRQIPNHSRSTLSVALIEPPFIQVPPGASPQTNNRSTSSGTNSHVTNVIDETSTSAPCNVQSTWLPVNFQLRPGFAQRSLPELIKATGDWYAQQHGLRKRSRTRFLPLQFNELTVSAIAKWASHDSSREQWTTIDTRYRVCLSCKRIGHYEVECPSLTRVDVMKLAAECSLEPVTLEAEPVYGVDDAKLYDVVVETCGGYLIEQWSRFAVERGDNKKVNLEGLKTSMDVDLDGFSVRAAKTVTGLKDVDTPQTEERRALASSLNSSCSFMLGDVVVWEPAVGDSLDNDHFSGNLCVGVVEEIAGDFKTVLVRTVRTLLPSYESRLPSEILEVLPANDSFQWIPIQKLYLNAEHAIYV